MRFFNSITRVLLVFAVAIVAFPAQDALANPLKKTVTNIAKAYSGYVVGNIIAPPKPPISPILKFDKRIIISNIEKISRDYLFPKKYNFAFPLIKDSMNLSFWHRRIDSVFTINDYMHQIRRMKNLLCEINNIESKRQYWELLNLPLIQDNYQDIVSKTSNTKRKLMNTSYYHSQLNKSLLSRFKGTSPINRNGIFFDLFVSAFYKDNQLVKELLYAGYYTQIIGGYVVIKDCETRESIRPHKLIKIKSNRPVYAPLKYFIPLK